MNLAFLGIENVGAGAGIVDSRTIQWLGDDPTACSRSMTVPNPNWEFIQDRPANYCIERDASNRSRP